MSRAGFIGGVAAFALIIVLAWMMPINYTGQARLAVLLIGILAGVFTYTTIESQLRSPRGL